jgi:acyl-CoA thioesterase FadM
VEFRAPVTVGQRVRLEGTFVRTRGRFIYGRGTVADAASGKLLARGRARFIAVDESTRSKFLGA